MSQNFPLCLPLARAMGVRAKSFTININTEVLKYDLFHGTVTTKKKGGGEEREKIGPRPNLRHRPLQHSQENQTIPCVESTLERWMTLRYPRNRHLCWEGFQSRLPDDKLGTVASWPMDSLSREQRRESDKDASPARLVIHACCSSIRILSAKA